MSVFYFMENEKEVEEFVFSENKDNYETIKIIEKEGNFLNILKLFSPGTSIRTAVDDMMRAKMGALIVVDKESFSNNFEGSGSTSRKEDLTASITTQVISRYPNGQLKIRGGKEVMVNNEIQIIYLTGIIRPVDITSTNTVSSTKVLNARISYTGKGAISDTETIVQQVPPPSPLRLLHLCPALPGIAPRLSTR